MVRLSAKTTAIRSTYWCPGKAWLSVHVYLRISQATSVVQFAEAAYFRPPDKDARIATATGAGRR